MNNLREHLRKSVKWGNNTLNLAVSQIQIWYRPPTTLVLLPGKGYIFLWKYNLRMSFCIPLKYSQVIIPIVKKGLYHKYLYHWQIIHYKWDFINFLVIAIVFPMKHQLLMATYLCLDESLIKTSTKTKIILSHSHLIGRRTMFSDSH